MTVQAQNDYPLELTRSVPGVVEDINPSVLKARTVESAAVPFGRAVRAGSTNKQLQLGATGRILGISVMNVAREAATVGADKVEYAANTDATYVVMGRINVEAKEDFTEGGAVYANDTTGEIYATTAAGRTVMPGWEFDTTGLAGEIAIIQRY